MRSFGNDLKGGCVGSSTTRALTVRVASRVRVEDASLWIAYRSGNAVETKSRERESVESTDACSVAIAYSSDYDSDVIASIGQYLDRRWEKSTPRISRKVAKLRRIASNKLLHIRLKKLLIS